MKVAAVDPGGKHCGVAWTTNGKTCEGAYTLNPHDFWDWSEAEIPKLDLLIYEGYRLFPWELKTQSWSRVETVETIGVILYLTRLHQVDCKEQLPPIKTPTQHVVDKLKLPLQKGDRHAQDAQLHLYHHLLQKKQPDN